jgi:hypothetical protein
MKPSEFAGLGLAPGVVSGTRSFSVDAYGRLTGVTHRQVWTPGENNAECRKRDDPYAALFTSGGYLSTAAATASATSSVESMMRRLAGLPAAPAPYSSRHDEIDRKPLQHEYAECACGFYGYFDGSDDFHDEKRISAVVEGYGETVIGTRGFRAKKARIVALTVRAGLDELTESMVRKVRRNYSDVPTFESCDVMVAEFAPDYGLEPSPDTVDDFWTRDAT